ncbi:MAG: signal peptidase II [Proteobacteria bacterium]|nr:signal peptidase II [Pseudomonadota bacterium]
MTRRHEDTTTVVSLDAAPIIPPLAASGWRWLPLTGAIIAADQGVKALIEQHFTLWQPVRVLPVLDFILTYNTGAAFSFLAQQAGWQRWLFAILALAVSGVLLGWLRRLRSASQPWLCAALALIVGGALGNLVDRLTRGRVVDFIDAHWAGHHFPAFNLADSAITVGAALLIIDAWFTGRAARRDRDTDGRGPAGGDPGGKA